MLCNQFNWKASLNKLDLFLRFGDLFDFLKALYIHRKVKVNLFIFAYLTTLFTPMGYYIVNSGKDFHEISYGCAAGK
jgi:hypothetical protein